VDGDPVVRTRFLDELVLTACAAGCRQVVALGAGLDARAFRLDVPAGLRWFELDTPDVAGWQTGLRAAGFRPERPTAWIVEGLLVYLEPGDVERLLRHVGALSSPGSHLGLTLARLTVSTGWRAAPRPEPPWRCGGRARRGTQWRGSPGTAGERRAS
jgi:O-methyltransferase involved in polyketide biosynthesis